MIKEEILKITNEELDALDLSAFKPFVSEYYQQYFFLNSGEEHYRLLVKICELFQTIDVLDIGTHHGMSALAMSNQLVTSYDIEEDSELLKLKSKILKTGKFTDVTFKIGNVLEDTNLHCYPLIFIDIDHKSKTEKEIIDFLIKNNYKGVVLLDDIYLPSMQHFWNVYCKDLDRLDVSHLGHFSGTGVIFF